MLWRRHVDKTVVILKKKYDITGGDELDFVLGIAIDYDREELRQSRPEPEGLCGND